MGSGVKVQTRDLCERTFEFSVRVVRLCQRLDQKPGVARTLGRQRQMTGRINPCTSVPWVRTSSFPLRTSPFVLRPSLLALRTCFRTSYFVLRTSCLALLLLSGCGDRSAQLPSSSPPDLSDHPRYRTYTFGMEEHVINVGVQPLWVPTSAISELMRRDALLQRALAAEGFEIRFHEFLKGADVNFFLERGDLEVGIGGDMPALSAAARSNVLITALMQQGFSSIVARRHGLLRDLVGKRIGYAFGSNAHYALLQALADSGLSEANVTLVPLDVNEMPGAFASRKIDAFSAFEPTPTIARIRNQQAVVIHRSLTSGYLYFARPLADRHPETVRYITASVLRAVRWASGRNLTMACRWALLAEREITGRQAVLSVEQYESLARDDLLGASRNAAIPASDLASGGRLFREFEFLKDLGLIPGQSGWEQVRSCFDLSVVDELLSHSAELGIWTCDYEGADE